MKVLNVWFGGDYTNLGNLNQAWDKGRVPSISHAMSMARSGLLVLGSLFYLSLFVCLYYIRQVLYIK